MKRQDQREAAKILERLARLVASGEVSAPAGFVGRLEGAAVGLLLTASRVRRPRKDP